MASKTASKSVPFGSGTRRPLGDVPIDVITQFTYIPDVRRMNAIQNVREKEQRTTNRGKPVQRTLSQAKILNNSASAQTQQAPIFKNLDSFAIYGGGVDSGLSVKAAKDSIALTMARSKSQAN